jgi:hypothetical protein
VSTALPIAAIAPDLAGVRALAAVDALALVHLRHEDVHILALGDLRMQQDLQFGSSTSQSSTCTSPGLLRGQRLREAAGDERLARPTLSGGD